MNPQLPILSGLDLDKIHHIEPIKKDEDSGSYYFVIMLKSNSKKGKPTRHLTCGFQGMVEYLHGRITDLLKRHKRKSHDGQE